MAKYIRVNEVEAEPMTRGAYNKMRGWTIPANENPADEGYKVTYPDGYVSWCPRAQFETNAYTTDEGSSFDSVPDAHMVHDLLQIFHDYHYCRSSPDKAMDRLTDALVGAYYTQFVHNPRMTFGDAIEAMKRGRKVARKGWNGKGMYLWLLPAAEVKKEWCRDERLIEVMANFGENVVQCLGSIRMLTATKEVLTGWLASQTDMLAEDWVVVE